LDPLGPRQLVLGAQLSLALQPGGPGAARDRLVLRVTLGYRLVFFFWGSESPWLTMSPIDCGVSDSWPAL